MVDVLRYRAEDAAEPVTEWLNNLRDRQDCGLARVGLKRKILATVTRSARALSNCGNMWAQATASIWVVMADRS